jgi:hypothetical protein
MNRHQRIEAAQAKLHELRPAAEAARKVVTDYEETERELRRAREMFDVGERVHVELTCRRGCCVEDKFDGVIEAVNEHGSYDVRAESGVLRRCIFSGSLRRSG